MGLAIHQPKSQLSRLSNKENTLKNIGNSTVKSTDQPNELNTIYKTVKLERNTQPI